MLLALARTCGHALRLTFLHHAGKLFPFPFILLASLFSQIQASLLDTTKIKVTDAWRLTSILIQQLSGNIRITLRQAKEKKPRPTHFQVIKIYESLLISGGMSPTRVWSGTFRSQKWSPVFENSTTSLHWWLLSKLCMHFINETIDA